MLLSPSEERALQEAFQAITQERENSLREMFKGTQLQPKSRLADAKTLAKEAKALKEKVANLPGVQVPSLKVPALNIHLFDGVDLRALVNFQIPSVALPGWMHIPDIRLGRIPGFDLPRVRLNLKGILKFKDLLPNISLRALVYALLQKWPDIQLPSLMLDLSKILSIDFDILFPDFKLSYPEFFDIDLKISLPHLSLPDLDLSALQLDLPDINLSHWLKVPGFDKVLRLLCELFDTLDLGDLIEELGLEFISEFVSSALPVIQQVKSGSQAVMSWGKAARDWHRAHRTAHHKPFLLPGNARDACDAVAVLLRNARDENASMAAIQSTQLAVSTAGLFADLGGVTGPAVSAVSALAKTCHKVLIMGARYKEMKKINALLQKTPEKDLASNIFEVSPLLGCYYLANSTTSTVLNILSKNLMEDNWMTTWEYNKKHHLDTLIRDAQRFIDESRYVLFPIRQSIGMYREKGFFEKIKEGVVLKAKKKAGFASAHATVSSHRYIGSK